MFIYLVYLTLIAVSFLMGDVPISEAVLIVVVRTALLSGSRSL